MTAEPQPPATITVAGLGFRTTTSLAALRDALTLAGGPGNLTALATPKAKAQSPAITALAAELNLPLLAIAPSHLQAQTTLTQSPRSLALYGTGSVAEAAALAGAAMLNRAGQGAHLIAPRATSTDGTATAAIASSESPHP